MPAAVERRGTRPTPGRVTCRPGRHRHSMAAGRGLVHRAGSLVLGQGRTWIDRRARVSPDGRAAACRRGEVGGSGSAGDARDGRPQDAPGERDRTRAGMAAGARRAAPGAAGGLDCAAEGRGPRSDVRGRLPGTRMGGSEMASRSRSRCRRGRCSRPADPCGPTDEQGRLGSVLRADLLDRCAQAGARHRVAVHSPGRRAANSPSGHLEHA